MSPEAINALMGALASQNPEPRSELDFRTPYELLVAVTLSAQSTDVGVNKVTPNLFALADTPQSMLELGAEGVERQIKTLGLYRAKAKHIVDAARMLIEQHGGQVPADRQALEALPGVGRKTANVVLNIAFGQPTLAVDTHVFRVANRTGLASGKTPEQVERQLLNCIPDQFLQHAHHWLLLQGRHICQARTPKCSTCTIRNYCEFPLKVH
jgi:endonuclease III